MAWDDNDTDEKTEAPSQHRRQEARESGNVVNSKDIYSISILMAGLFTLNAFGQGIMEQIMSLSRFIFANMGKLDITSSDLNSYAIILVFSFFKLIFPFMLVLMVTAVSVGFLQHGFVFSLKPLMPSLGKLNLFSGGPLKSLFSVKSLVNLVINVGKIVIIGRIVYLSINEIISQIAFLSDLNVPQIFCVGCGIIYNMVLKICMWLWLLALIDYGYQKWNHEKNLMMTKSEVRDETKRFEGNPQIKSRVRSIQMQMARQRMLKSVPEADVIITNPTHYAVAVKYDAEDMAAPKVVAKGARLMAQRIKDIAIDNDIPIVENKPLAQALYKTVDVGKEVPEKLYQAVAEILAYVYQLNKGKLREVMGKLSGVMG